jgi:phosphonate transport system substrate-binding protein
MSSGFSTFPAACCEVGERRSSYLQLEDRGPFNAIARDLALFVILGSLLVTGCSRDGTPTQKVSFQTRQTLTTASGHQRAGTIRIAVGGMITPQEGFGYYRQFLDYLGEQMGAKVEFVDRTDYAEINKLVNSGNVDVAFVCSGPYVDGYRDFGMELLVAPQAYGKTVYYSYIIVPYDSPARGLKDLRGKRFAFTDPLSNTGALAPTYMLAKMGETPGSFFRKLIYTSTHDKAVHAVAEKLVDGAAIDSLIFEYMKKTHPEVTVRTMILQKSPPYGIPPVVVRAGLDPAFKGRLRDAFLNAHADEKGAVILKGMAIDRFVPIDDREYDSVRRMKRWIAEQDARKRGN